jgi:hypothetical protein
MSEYLKDTLGYRQNVFYSNCKETFAPEKYISFASMYSMLALGKENVL